MPKQFLRLHTALPLLDETIARLRRLLPAERIWLVGGRGHERLMRAHASELPPENILAEPIARNSTGAVGLAMARILRRDPEAVFTAFHSDHIVLNLDAFEAAVSLAARLAAEGPIVNVGTPPTYPETGFGYVERGARVAAENGVVAFDVVRFVEKPDLARARRFLEAGTFLWNLGMFTWRASVVRDLLREHLPGSVERFERTESNLERDPDAALAAFAELPNLAIDYAILEKADDRRVVEADLGWRDVGDWESMYQSAPSRDSGGNVLPADAVAVDTRGTYVSTARAGKVVATIGIDDLVIVDTEDALLVASRKRAQDVRTVIEELRRMGREEKL